MNEKDVNAFVSGFLMPRLDEFGEFLSNAGLKYRLTVADGAAPGIKFRLPTDEREIFVTFIKVNDDEENERSLLRLAYRPGDGLPYQHWALPYERVNDIQKLETAINMLVSGIADTVYPPAPEEDLNAQDGTTKADDAPDKAAEDVSDAEGEASDDAGLNEADGFDPDKMSSMLALMPRLNTLSSYLEEAEYEHTGVIRMEIPFIQVMEEDLILTLSYEQWDDNTFLFGIRTDIPASEEATEEELADLCGEFNAKNTLVRAAVGDAPFPVYDGEILDGKTVSLYLAFPEFGGMPEGDDYFLAISLFLEEAQALMDFSSQSSAAR